MPQTALAVPRVTPLDKPSGVALPQPLGPSDASLMRLAFTLEARGALAAADMVIRCLQNDLLVGQLQAARYLGRFHWASAAELTAWLQRYGDEPDAPAIRALLRRRLPPGATLPPLPSHNGLAARPVRESPPDTAVHKEGQPPQRQPAPGASQADAAIRTLFTQNHDRPALVMAEQMLRRGSTDVPSGQAIYIGGLAAWRLGEIRTAGRLFATAATLPGAPPQHVAAAAFWRARAADREQDHAAARGWLRRAAAQAGTFHGLLARSLLDMPTDVTPVTIVLTQADVDAIAALPGGQRAFALLQAGQSRRAAAELRGLWTQVQADPALRRALILVASGVGLTDCAWQLAARDAALAPRTDAAILGLLRPADGFRVNPALIYAVAKVESRFDPTAVSPAGARGLMQLMPITVTDLNGGRLRDLAALHDPAQNLALGQRYLLRLAEQDAVGGDLLRLLASYNDGPGGLARWQSAVRDHGDPLLFIEAIPVDETRRFVRQVLTYTWLYAARLNLPAPSLDEMAAGAFPRFTPLPDRGKILAARLP